MSSFKVDVRDIPRGREPGISGFMRVRNEIEFLAQAIETHLLWLDELVIVHNRCDDGSDELIEDYAERYPKIKAFHYEPHVYPQGSAKHFELPPGSEHSFVNYTNYALAKTTRKIVTKVDADHIAVPSRLKYLTDGIRRGFLGVNDFLLFWGVNLWREDDRLLVKVDYPWSGKCGDIGFFHVTENTYYIRVEGGEALKTTAERTVRRLDGGPLYFHMKAAKQDHGITNYDLKENPGSRYVSVSEEELKNQRSVNWPAFVAGHPEIKEFAEFPDPNDFITLTT